MQEKLDESLSKIEDILTGIEELQDCGANQNKLQTAYKLATVGIWRELKNARKALTAKDSDLT